jgi:hypothetical protein
MVVRSPQDSRDNPANGLEMVQILTASGATRRTVSRSRFTFLKCQSRASSLAGKLAG